MKTVKKLKPENDPSAKTIEQAQTVNWPNSSSRPGMINPLTY